MKRLTALLPAAVLLAALWAGCASPPPPPSPQAFLHDELFHPPARPIDAEAVFAASDAMKRYVHVDIARQLRTEGLQRGLINALYRRGELKLDYDAAITRNASQAFDARAGNCLSLVIMTAAFAKELGLQVNYQSVVTEQTWSRSDDLLFENGHVNLTLGARATSRESAYDENRTLTIDFLPPEDLGNQRTRSISEDTVVAMYMNNRSAEALARGQFDDAYAWARAAVVRAPGFSPAHNTLGVVYLRHGDLQAAEPVLRGLLDREPRNTQALANLAAVLDKLGRGSEAAPLRARLAAIEPDPPYHFLRLGQAAMRRGDYTAARILFAKEVERADYNSEFHYWLGLANLRLGNLQEARKHLAIAMANSTTRGDHDLYAAKLDRLRSDGLDSYGPQ